MEKIPVEGPKAPIGFLASLWKGVEFVNAHPAVILIPVLVDAFLWLGPHLSVYALIRPVVDAMAASAAANTANAPVIDSLRQAAQDFNLFSLLAFLPLFPPSLMAGVSPIQTPLGNPIVLTVGNWFAAGGAAAVCLAASLALGSAYWVWAGRTVRQDPWTPADAAARWGRTFLIVSLLSAGFLVLILGAAVPVLVVVSVVGMVSPTIGAGLAQLIIFLGGGLLFWLILFFMFSMHGTALYKDGLLPAVWNSVNTTRWMYPLSIWVPILLLLANFLAAQVWALAPAGSWSGAVGVVGNAYTSSVVVVASMAYYADKRRWISEAQAYLQSRLSGKTPPGPS
jgi:hypothetical protein